MKRSLFGLLSVAAILAIASCSGDPTGDLQGGVSRISATPTVVFVDSGAVKDVDVQALDAQGNPLATNFSIAITNPAVVSIAEDTTFRPGLGGEALTHRYDVTALSLGLTPVTFSASGESVTIMVRTTPTNLDVVTLSSLAPALGDTVTVTAPAPFKFTPGSVVTAGGAAIVQGALAADSSSIKFLPGPGANSHVSVSGTVLAYAPGVGTFTVTTSPDTLITPAVTTIPTTYAPSATPAAGVAVTASAAGFVFLPTTIVTINGRESYILSFAPDSSSVTFVPPPGQTGAAAFSNVALDFLSGAPLSNLAGTALTVGASPYTGTDDPATAPAIAFPASGNSVTIYDNGTTGAGIFGADRVYTFTLAAATTFSMTLDWSNAEDIDILLRNGANTAFVCGFSAATGAQPEVLDPCSLAAGTYFLVLNKFSTGADPGVLALTIAVN